MKTIYFLAGVVCHRGNVEAAIIGLPVDALPEHGELVLNDMLDGDANLFVCH